jgi:ubiquinone/menaquinone biosynthesis C-methylase UbiE
MDWSNVYTDFAAEYELLVSHEDYQGNLPAAIRDLQPLEGRRAVEFGCGTGRVTGLLAGSLRELHAFDLTPAMLQIAAGKKVRHSWVNVHMALADSRYMPLAGGWADFAIQGWAFLHIAVWHPDDWQIQLGRALDEMRRLVRPGGRMILIETLGTGETAPNPAPAFRVVYDWLEQVRGFRASAIRTDYRFETMEQVEQVVLPLFGEAMRPRLERTPQGIILPECTGLWWREADRAGA